MPAARLVATVLVTLLACRATPPVAPDTGTPPPDDSVPEVVDPSWPVLFINEFMASNHHVEVGPTGDRPDWLEIWNPGEEDVDLAGWSVSDDLDEPGKHPLDALTVPARGWLLLQADGDPEDGPDHLSFTLDADGEALGLFAPDETAVDALTFGRQAADHAAARRLDGGTEWAIVAAPTPGASNGAPAVDPTPADPWPGPPAPCALTSDLPSPYLLEGDRVSLTVGCSGALSDADAVLEPVTFPHAGTWSGHTFTWATGPADGGRVDLVVSVRTQGETGEIPSAETVTFWVADDPANPANVPVDPATYTEEWGLPVFHVLPEGAVSQTEVPAVTWLDGRAYDTSFSIRGASSSWYTKPGYLVETTDAEIEVGPWGVTRDHLILLTLFDDNSYVRQKLTYDTWAAMAEFWGLPRLVPRTFFAVVYLSGSYHGLFVALDHVDDEFLDQMGYDRESNLYKAVSHDANFYLTNASGYSKSTLHDGYTKEEGEPADNFADLDAFVEFTGNATAEQIIADVGGWMDQDEILDWFLLACYATAADSAGKNSYLATRADETFFHYAPWDFNHSWGQDWETFRVPATDVYDYSWNNRIFWAIHSVPEAEAALWDRFAAMQVPGGPFDPATLQARVDAYYALIEPSARRDWDTWEDAYRTYGGWAWYRDSMGDWTDYDGEKAYLTQWLADRAAVFSTLPPGQ